MNPYDLVVEQLRVDVGRRTILDVPEVRVPSGEVLAILGPNGAGKSTLLKTCLGFRRPTVGRVHVLGHDVTRLGTLALNRLRRRVAYIPQELAAYHAMPLTVREVVAIGRTGLAGLLRPLRPADWQIVDAWIERLGLAALARAAYSDLSGGEQRKALIARAMVQEPRMIVLDEPTAHLDLGWREHIVTTLDTLVADARPTVLLVCHELEVLPQCCRRLILLHDGRVAAIGTPEDVLTPQRVQTLYGPGLHVWHDGGRHAVLPRGGATE